MTFDNDTTYYRKTRDGEAFIVSEMDTVAADGGTFNVHLENPTDSGQRLWIIAMRVQTTRTYSSVVYDQYSESPSGGTSLDIQNVLMDSEGTAMDDGVANANVNVSFTNGTSNHVVGVGGGGSGGTAIGGSSAHATIVLEPGREIVVESTNESSSEAMHAITILYYETPV